MHDLTTLERQGADAGTQYRSAIFYHNEAQKAIAGQVIEELNKAKIWANPIVTQVVPLEKFYPAEEYHQQYFLSHPERPYCQVVISPKIAKFRRKWAKRLVHSEG